MQTEAIRFVQRSLKISETGLYCERTRAAVQAFQLAEKLKLDPQYEQFGEVGPVTWQALNKLCDG